jgi:hypothetical protein
VGEVEESELERQNTQCLLLFHEKLTNFLKYCNVRITTQEERKAEHNMENILNQILSVQNQIKAQSNNEEVKKAIVSMRGQISGDFENKFSKKINELVNQFATSSESLHELCLKMSSEI